MKVSIVLALVLLVSLNYGYSQHKQLAEENSKNEDLELQLLTVNDKIQQAQSDLEDLKSDIDSGVCDDKAGEVESELDEAEESAR